MIYQGAVFHNNDVVTTLLRHNLPVQSAGLSQFLATDERLLEIQTEVARIELYFDSIKEETPLREFEEQMEDQPWDIETKGEREW